MHAPVLGSNIFFIITKGCAKGMFFKVVRVRLEKKCLKYETNETQTIEVSI